MRLIKEKIVIDLLSRANHLNQIITGYYRVAKLTGKVLEITDCCKSEKYKMKKTAAVVYINGKVLVYDMADGYQSIDVIKYLLGLSDYYFKRSFNKQENEKHGLCGLLPLTMNYDVTYFGNPILNMRKLGKLRALTSLISGKLITPEKIEHLPESKDSYRTVLFSARLWPNENQLTESENEERQKINKDRIAIIRYLKKELGPDFFGGIADSTLAQEMAPDLILPQKCTNRYSYIKTMQNSDICIASMGLHKSIGFKMGEYVAASRAIVSEKLYYEIPGEFGLGNNYLEFSTADECISCVEHLLTHPEEVYKMQLNNHDYYTNYLKPEKIILNSLKIAGVEEDI